GVSSDEDLCGLHERVVLVAADDEEAGQLPGRLRERAVSDQNVRVWSTPDRPCLAAVGEPGAASHSATTRREQLAELEVDVEGGLMVGLGAGPPLCLVVGGEHDDVVGHDASFR